MMMLLITLTIYIYKYTVFKRIIIEHIRNIILLCRYVAPVIILMLLNLIVATFLTKNEHNSMKDYI